MEHKKNVPIWARIPNGVWVAISLLCAVALWLFVSAELPAVFAPPAEVWACLLYTSREPRT